MVRRHDDVVDVQLAAGVVPGPGGPDGDGVIPRSFVWRGQRYLVRSVVAKWHERRSWWRDPGSERDVDGTPAGAGAPSPGDRLVWRVEATRSARHGAAGVFDLCADPPTGPAGERRWRLLRIHD